MRKYPNYPQLKSVISMNYFLRTSPFRHLLAIVFALIIQGGGFAHAEKESKAFEPTGLILTWREDPSSSIIIDWHEASDEPPEVFSYREPGDGDAAWETVLPEPPRAFPFAPRRIYRVALNGLKPDTLYQFRLGRSYLRTFRTLPATLTRPVKFAIGGDMMHWEEARVFFAKMNRVVAARDPDFIVWGGDMAYEDGRMDRVDRMLYFLEVMRDTLVTAEGRIIPVLVGAGNHEPWRGNWVNTPRGREGWQGTDAERLGLAPYFYSLWAFPGHPGYAALDLGDYASLLMLDSNHTGPIEGPQTEWLEAQLAMRPHVGHLIPVYHVPAYPSVRPFEYVDPTSGIIRRLWVPLFDKHGIRLVFENHDHAYKRTVPLRGGEEHADGVVYAGDGAWGVRLKQPEADRPYLARAEAVHHAFEVTIHRNRLDVVAISSAGDEFDRFSVPDRAVEKTNEGAPSGG